MRKTIISSLLCLSATMFLANTPNPPVDKPPGPQSASQPESTTQASTKQMDMKNLYQYGPDGVVAEGEYYPESVCGWDVRSDRVRLIGVVTGYSFSGGSVGDWDWSLFVRPDPDYAYLLINSYGNPNADGTIECEVQPPDRVLGWEMNNFYAMWQYFSPLMDKRVIVEGTWSQEATSFVFGPCHNNKTEIHPIISVFQADVDPYQPPVSATPYNMRFLVFSNSSSFDAIVRPQPVPFNRWNNLAPFLTYLPRPDADMSRDMGYFRTFSEVNAADSRSFDFLTPGYFSGVVQSGIADTGRGFYYTSMRVGPEAAFISQVVPTIVNAATYFNVSIRMRSLFYTWRVGSESLGSQNPPDTLTWGTTRVAVPYEVVAPGEAVFNFSAVAPYLPGVYNFQWRMVSDSIYGADWFGQYTPNVEITVCRPECY